jgi:hypothetical protein
MTRLLAGLGIDANPFEHYVAETEPSRSGAGTEQRSMWGEEL